MMAGSHVRAVVASLAAASLFLSSTAVAAASPMPAVQQVSPWATLTFLSGGASAAAVCGAAGVTAAQPATGCVLPVVDVVPVAAVPPPPVPVAAAPVGYGITPLLAGLIAIAAGIGLFMLVKGNNHSNSPG